jgi:TolB-like protein
MPAGAVFLSYASEDAAAAERIAGALRSAGIEVWFDKSELRGGDAWDRSIRRQIHDCRLFIAVISAHTEARDEGYFRREWRLAVERAGDMAEGKAFLVPLVIDATPERGSSVPEKFHELQWTRLRDGETSPDFVARMQKLVIPDAATGAAVTAPIRAGSTAARAPKRSLHPNWPSNAVLWVISALLAMGLAYLIVVNLWRSQHSPVTPPSEKTASGTSATASTAAVFNPPPHSIAVLPFVNMSGDKEQEYFSEGLTEELLNSLSRINELQVAARTSSFSFQGEHPDISTVAHKLNVAAVLEGSVRRSAHTVRITAQLVSGVTGFHVWSETYDRNLGDVLKLQTEIATAVASALKVTLLGNEAAKIELGGTRDPAALDAYLRGWRLLDADTLEKEESAIAVFGEAIRRDPNYALAFAARATAWDTYSKTWATLKGKDAHAAVANALADALHAVAMAPNLAAAHLAVARVRRTRLEFAAAGEAFRKALALEPGNADALQDYSFFAADMGDTNGALSAAHRAVSLDPLNAGSLLALSSALESGHRYQEALAPLEEWRSREPGAWGPRVRTGELYYLMGDFQRAAELCEVEGPPAPVLSCLARAYYKIGRRADADASRAKLYAAVGDAQAYRYARIYAQWGNTAESLRWLETAWRQRDPKLASVKTDPLLDPLRNEPRFQAIERALKFPEN